MKKYIAVSKSWVYDRVKMYGFVEVDVIIKFLDYVCYEKIDDSGMIYIRNKARECLNRHDNKSMYFSNLREVVNFIDFIFFCKKNDS